MSARLPVVAIALALLGCRDKDASAPASSSGSAGSAARSSSRPPALPDEVAAAKERNRRIAQELVAPRDRMFEQEPADAAWAQATEPKLRAIASWVTDVSCKTRQCRVIVVGNTAEDTMAKSDQLRAVRDIEGLVFWQLSPPLTRDDGTLEVHVFARFDR